MIIEVRLYRAVKDFEREGVSSIQPKCFDELLDYKYFADAMYSHEIVSYLLGENKLLFSWTPDYSIAKEFYNGKKGAGGYVAIAYIDVLFDTKKEMPVDLSDEVLFAYPVNKRENWIDMLILRDYYAETDEPGSEHLTYNNMNYNCRRKPYVLSNLLRVRNSAFNLASSTKEYVLILKEAKYSIIEDVENYKEPSNVNKMPYTGITKWILKKAREDEKYRRSVSSIVNALEKDVNFFHANKWISENDRDDISKMIKRYKKSVA